MKTWNITPTSTPSLAAAAQQAQPGDTILLSGVFRNTSLVPKVSGMSVAPITYKAAPAGATFDGAGPSGVAAISGRSYLVFDGIKFTNSVYKTAPVANRGIIVRSSSHVTFQNCNFSYMQMQLITSAYNTIGPNNTWREFVARYLNGKPQTSGDMLNLVLGSHDNEITGNDMKYAGHSLIELGNGTGNAETNANNWIHDNTLSNPWYKCLILSDNGAGTVVEDNQLLDTSSVPTLYSTVPGAVGQLDTSSEAVQFSGENFILRNNLIDNAVATYGIVTLGGRWYTGAGAALGGTLVEAMNNQIYGNTIQNSKGAAVFSFIEFLSKADKAAGRTAVPRITGNLIHDNTLAGNTGTPYSWNKSTFHSTIIYHSATEAPQWIGLNDNEIHDNHCFDTTNAYLIDGVFPGGVNVHKVKTLAQFEALDPTRVYGNS